MILCNQPSFSQSHPSLKRKRGIDLYHVTQHMPSSFEVLTQNNNQVKGTVCAISISKPQLDMHTVYEKSD